MKTRSRAAAPLLCVPAIPHVQVIQGVMFWVNAIKAALGWVVVVVDCHAVGYSRRVAGSGNIRLPECPMWCGVGLGVVTALNSIVGFAAAWCVVRKAREKAGGWARAIMAMARSASELHHRPFGGERRERGRRTAEQQRRRTTPRRAPRDRALPPQGTRIGGSCACTRACSAPARSRGSRSAGRSWRWS